MALRPMCIEPSNLRVGQRYLLLWLNTSSIGKVIGIVELENKEINAEDQRFEYYFKMFNNKGGSLSGMYFGPSWCWACRYIV